MKKFFLVFSFLTFGVVCIASGYYIEKFAAHKQSAISIQSPPLSKGEKSPISMTIPVLGCAIKNGECECYGRETQDFSFSGTGKMNFDVSVCENYIKHSGGAQYITVFHDPDNGSMIDSISEKLKSYKRR